MPLSLRLSESEEAAVKSFARSQGITVSEFARTAMLDRIEEEYLIPILEEYERERAAGTLVTYTHDEVWKELGL